VHITLNGDWLSWSGVDFGQIIAGTFRMTRDVRLCHGGAPPAILTAVREKVLVQAFVLEARVEVGVIPRLVGVEISGIAAFRAPDSDEWKWTVDCWGSIFCGQNDRRTCPLVAISIRRKLAQTQ
jgi:hypothetical protein